MLEFEQLKKDIDALPEDDQQLVREFVAMLKKRHDHSTENSKAPQTVSSARNRKLSEFKGIVEYPFVGEDAQAWVSRSRQLSDEQRDRSLGKTHES